MQSVQASIIHDSDDDSDLRVDNKSHILCFASFLSYYYYYYYYSIIAFAQNVKA